MFRFQTTLDVNVKDQHVLMAQLEDLSVQTGQDLLPALMLTILRIGESRGVLYLTMDLLGILYWTTDEPTAWPMGLVIAEWRVVQDHEGEVEVM